MRHAKLDSRHIARLVARGRTALCVCLLTGSSAAHADEVLLLQPIEQRAPEHGAIEVALRSELANSAIEETQVYAELADFRFQRPRDREAFASYLQAKYGDVGLDAVIGLSDEAVEFFAAERDVIGDVPLVFVARDGSKTERILKSSAVVVPLVPSRTFDLALRLQPELAHLFVVSGAGSFDESDLVELRAAARAYSSRLDAEFLSGLSQDDLLDRVARLPSGSFVVYAPPASAPAANAASATETARRIADRSNAPVYALSDIYLGQGVVGGYVARSERIGAAMARQTLRALRGEYANAVDAVGGSYVVDARALSRWDLDQTRLPADAEVLFASPSIWKLYQGWIVTLLVLVAVQFALIVALLIQSISRRRDRLELAETAHRFRLARAAGKVGIWQWDVDKGQMIVEPELRELLGYDVRDGGELAASVYVHDEDLPKLRIAAQDHARGATPSFEIQHRMWDKNGNVRWFLSRGQALVARGRLIGTAIDITDRKRDEDERAETLLKLAEQRNELAHLGRAAMAGALSGAVAHELNQPLSAMMSNARAALQFLAGGPVDRQEIKDILADIESDGRRAGDVIRHLRSLLRRGEANFEAVHLDVIIDQVLRLIHSDLVSHNVKVTRERIADVPPVSADSVQLQQVILNLLSNACDALKSVNPRDRRISIGVTMRGTGQVRLTVSDNGCGFVEGNPEQLFKPFVTTKRSGLGLGLSISRSIVDAHGGRIWAESNRDAGAAFHVDLACASAAERVA
jgi:PAS domain S-box-containing protein